MNPVKSCLKTNFFDHFTLSLLENNFYPDHSTRTLLYEITNTSLARMEILIVISTILLLLLAFILGIIGINSPQKYRPAILISIIALSYFAFQNASDEKLGFEIAETLSMFIIIYVSHMGCILFIEKYNLPNKTPSLDWRGGFNMLFNARFIGTHRQVQVYRDLKSDVECENEESKAQEQHSTRSWKDFRIFLQSRRGVFLRKRALSCCTIIALMQLNDYAFSVLAEMGIQVEMMDFLPSKESYFRRLTSVTLRETIIRTWVVISWLFYSIGLYTAIHDALAFVFVATDFNKQEEWPPLFGSLSEATSIRNLWGKTWHKLIYRSYTSYGKFISLHVLRFPKNSMAGRIFINFFVFAMSGTAHAVTVRQLGYACATWRDLQFYLLCFAAILVETMVLLVFKKLAKGNKVNRIVRRTIGYVWVFLFLFATLPKSQYPKVWCAPTGDE